MAKKQLNTDSIANDLQRSAFFPISSPALAPKGVETPIAADTAEVTPEKPQDQRGSLEARKRGNVETRSSLLLTSATSGISFHLVPEAKADQKYTLAFTDAEMEAMEDVKLELRRRFGIKTTKVELVRCGLGELIEDYLKHGDQSRIVTRLKSRK